jgi:hypothetical protein
MTVAGLAVALVASLFRPSLATGWAIGAAIAGVVLILVGLTKLSFAPLIRRFGIGLAFGAAILYLVVATHLLPTTP